MSVAAMMMVVMVAMLYHTAQSVSHPNNQLTRHPTIQPSIQRPHTLVSARGNLENFKTIHDLLCEQAIYSFYSACISSASFAIASSSSSISFEIFYFQINIGKLFSRIRNIKQKEKHLNCFNYNFTVGKFKITFFWLKTENEEDRQTEAGFNDGPQGRA